MQSTIQRKVTESVEPTAVTVDSVKLTVVTHPETGEVIERRLDVDLSHDEDEINAVESALVERLRSEARR